MNIQNGPKVRTLRVFAITNHMLLIGVKIVRLVVQGFKEDAQYVRYEVARTNCRRQLH